MKRDLILTGWSKPVYLAAAAAALRALNGKADVAGVSMEALAQLPCRRSDGIGAGSLLRMVNK